MYSGDGARPPRVSFSLNVDDDDGPPPPTPPGSEGGQGTEAGSEGGQGKGDAKAQAQPTWKLPWFAVLCDELHTLVQSEQQATLVGKRQRPEIQDRINEQNLR